MSDLFGNHIVGFPTRRLIWYVNAQFGLKGSFFIESLPVSSQYLQNNRNVTKTRQSYVQIIQLHVNNDIFLYYYGNTLELLHRHASNEYPLQKYVKKQS